MLSFELVLVPREGSVVDPGAVWHAIEQNPHVRPERGVPGKLTYYNRATTVHFGITLGDALLPEEEVQVGGMIPAHLDVLSDSSVGSRASRRDEEDDPDQGEGDEDDEDEGEGDEDDEDEPHVELPPVSVQVPLFRPTFFLAEARAFLEALRNAADLRLVMPAAESAERRRDETPESPAVSTSPDRVVRRWQEVHRDVFEELADKENVWIWTAERCASFYEYNRRLAELADEIAIDGLEVVPIQPARHEGTIRTLCVWRCDRPAVIPKTDLVLVRRPRPGGLFRRAKVEELLVPGETLWRLLERFGESRHGPVPLLIVRAMDEAPGQLQADVEALEGERTENAKRTELAGVVDFELA